MVCRAADLLLEYFRCARFEQGAFLRRQRLAFSADARVTVGGHFVYLLIRVSRISYAQHNSAQHRGPSNPPAIALKMAVRASAIMSGTMTPAARFRAFVARATGK